MAYLYLFHETLKTCQKLWRIIEQPTQVNNSSYNEYNEYTCTLALDNAMQRHVHFQWPASIHCTLPHNKVAQAVLPELSYNVRVARAEL